MIILFYNKHEGIKIKYHNNIISSEKSEKKIKKKFGRGRMFTAALVQGGRGCLQRL